MEGGKYNLEKAQEEAVKLSKKKFHGELKTYGAAERMLEKEKSREGKLYHSTMLQELFMIWRDGEVPMRYAWPYGRDSDGEPNSVLTYWFKEPIEVGGFGSNRGIFLELDKNLIDPENISEGEMRFESTREDYNGNQHAYDNRIDEVYIKERIPIDKIKIYITKKEKESLAEERKRLQENMAECQRGFEPSVSEYDLIARLKDYEFGRDNFPDGYQTKPWFKNLPSIELKNYGLDEEPEYRGRSLTIDPEKFLKLADKIMQFYDWALMLPLASDREKEEPDLVYKNLQWLGESYRPESREKSQKGWQNSIKRATEFIEELEKKGMSKDTPYGKILILKDVTYFDAGLNAWKSTPKFQEEYKGFLHIGTGKGFDLKCEGQLNERRIKNYLGEKFQGEITTNKDHRGVYTSFWQYNAWVDRRSDDAVLNLTEDEIIAALKS